MVAEIGCKCPVLPFVADEKYPPASPQNGVEVRNTEFLQAFRRKWCCGQGAETQDLKILRQRTRIQRKKNALGRKLGTPEDEQFVRARLEIVSSGLRPGREPRRKLPFSLSRTAPRHSRMPPSSTPLRLRATTDRVQGTPLPIDRGPPGSARAQRCKLQKPGKTRVRANGSHGTGKDTSRTSQNSIPRTKREEPSFFKAIRKSAPQAQRASTSVLAKKSIREFPPRPRFCRPFPRGQPVQGRLQGLNVESFAVQKAPFPNRSTSARSSRLSRKRGRSLRCTPCARSP